MNCILRNPRDPAIGKVTVWPEEGFEVAGPRGNTTAPKLPFRDKFLAELRVVVKLGSHLLRGKPHSFFIIIALPENIERLVGTGNDTLPVLEMELWILEPLLLFFRVCWVRIVVFSTQVRRWWCSVIHPRRASDEVLHIGTGEFSHLGDNLNARGAIPDDGYPLIGIVVVVVPAGRVCYMPFEVSQSGDIWP